MLATHMRGPCRQVTGDGQCKVRSCYLLVLVFSGLVIAGYFYFFQLA
ncbi:MULTISPECIES: hypothetical protein [Pseudomonas]